MPLPPPGLVSGSGETTQEGMARVLVARVIQESPDLLVGVTIKKIAGRGTPFPKQ